MTTTRWISVTAIGVCLFAACKGSKPTLGAAASALASSAPLSSASSLTIQAASSKLDFTMEAPFEKIYGEAPGAIQGQIAIDPHDLTRSRGLIRVDLTKLSLFQQKRDDAASQYGDKVNNPKQNEHMRQWFGIDEAVPAVEREKNRWADFSIDSVNDASATDLGKLSGTTRTITAKIGGELLLHGRKAPKSIKVEAAFGYAGERLASVAVKSLEPLEIALKEHDIRPPDANTSEKVLQSWLGLFGKKVAERAPVNLSFVAAVQ